MFFSVKDGDDPLCNVVLLEDAAGVFGNIICGIAITASYALGKLHLNRTMCR